MLTSFRDIVAKNLHKDEIYTSIVLPTKLHDPHARVKAPSTSFLCLGPNGRTYYRDVDHGPVTLNIEWVPTKKWILEAEKTTAENVNESAYRDTFWVKWSEVKSLWKIQATETKMVEQRKESMKEAVINGAKLAMANKASNVAVDVMASLAPPLAPHMENEALRALLKIVGGLVIQHTADAAGPEKAPFIKATAELIVTAGVMELTESQLDKLTPAFDQLLALGKKIA